MVFHEDLRVFGDRTYRGKCPKEDVELVKFFAWLRNAHPALGAIATHIRNEGRRTGHAANKMINEGLLPGAPDIVILGSPALLIELKRRDSAKSKWAPNQEATLLTAQQLGAFACVALGWEAAKEAVEEWLSTHPDYCPEREDYHRYWANAKPTVAAKGVAKKAAQVSAADIARAKKRWRRGN